MEQARAELTAETLRGVNDDFAFVPENKAARRFLNNLDLSGVEIDGQHVFGVLDRDSEEYRNSTINMGSLGEMNGTLGLYRELGHYDTSVSQNGAVITSAPNIAFFGINNDMNPYAESYNIDDVRGLLNTQTDYIEYLNATNSGDRQSVVDGVTADAQRMNSYVFGLAQKPKDVAAEWDKPLFDDQGEINIFSQMQLEYVGENSGALAAISLGNVTRGLGKLTPNGVGESPKIEGATNKTQLIDELRASGTKITLENVVDIQKLPDGRTVWLEIGNKSAGLKHILDGKSEYFARKGVSEDEIPSLIFDALQNGRVVDTIGSGRNVRSVYEVEFNSSTQTIAIGISNNGFIVTAHPYTVK